MEMVPSFDAGAGLPGVARLEDSMIRGQAQIIIRPAEV